MKPYEMYLPEEFVEELLFAFGCRSRWLDLVIRIADYLGLSKIPTLRYQIEWNDVAILDESGKRISWSRFHRQAYRYWNNWLVFWLRVKYWIKLGAWF